MSPQSVKAKIISIASGKGGTGKSIIASSIGYALAFCKKRVLLVDFDLFTHGLTFFIIGDRPIRIHRSISDALGPDKVTPSEIDIIRVDPDTLGDYLSMMPSISSLRIDEPEIMRFKDSHDIMDMVSSITRLLLETHIWNFDYIIIDTRGGTDATSVSAVLASDLYLFVTEADKPSWDMGDILIKTIEGFPKATERLPERGGFILNKNVLPDEAVIAFLRRKWRMQHLATIPLSDDVVRNFQQDTIPISDSKTSIFASKIFNVVKSVTQNDDWHTDHRSILQKAIVKCEEKLKFTQEQKRREKRLVKMSMIFRIYTTVIAAMLLIYVLLIQEAIYNFGTFDRMFIIMSIALIVITMMVDFSITFRYISKRFNQKDDEEHK